MISQIRKANTGDTKSIASLIESLRLDMAGFVWNEVKFIEKQIRQKFDFSGSPIKIVLRNKRDKE